jgi:hypothetical protein
MLGKARIWKDGIKKHYRIPKDAENCIVIYLPSSIYIAVGCNSDLMGELSVNY